MLITIIQGMNIIQNQYITLNQRYMSSSYTKIYKCMTMAYVVGHGYTYFIVVFFYPNDMILASTMDEIMWSIGNSHHWTLTFVV